MTLPILLGTKSNNMIKQLILSLVMFGTFAAKASSQSIFMLTGIGATSTSNIIDSLMSGSVTSGATMDINFSAFAANYRVIIVRFSAAPSASSAILLTQVSTNGTTWDNTASGYGWWDNFGGFTNNTADTCIEMLSAVASAAGTRLTGQFEIDDINSTTFHPQIYGFVAGLGASDFNVMFSGRRKNAQVTKGLRIRFQGSTTITGAYIVYGMH